MRGAEQQLRAEQHREQSRACQQQRGQRQHHAGSDGHQADEHEHEACPEALADHPAWELHEGVGEEKGLLQPADLHLAEVEVRHDPVTRHGEASLLHVGDEAESEQEQEDLPAHADALRSGEWDGGSTADLLLQLAGAHARARGTSRR